MVNAIYRAAIKELETVLPPRVVSGSLNAGLKKIGKSPKNVEYGDIEQVLKSQIYKQLQVVMKGEKAKEAIHDILEKLENVEDKAEESTNFLDQQERIINSFQKAFRLFNLYIEWPEVQKLRSLLKLIEEGHNQKKEVSQLIANAKTQFKKAEEKLNDQLVQQDAEIQRLEETYEALENLEGINLRRLGRLIGQIKSAQQSKQLVSGEIARARKLIADLRKQISEEDRQTLPQIEDKSAQVDKAEDKKEDVENLLVKINDEIYDLENLGKDFANLLVFKPEFAQKLADLEQRLDKEGKITTFVNELRQDLVKAQSDLRETLKAELSLIQKDVLAMDGELDTQQLKQNLQVTLDVLENTLPAEADVREINDLYRLLKQRADELKVTREKEQQAFEIKLKQQGEALDQFKSLLERYSPKTSSKEYKVLSEKLAALTEIQEVNKLDNDLVSEVRQAAEALESFIAKQTADESSHQRAYIGALLMQLQTVPITASIKKKVDKLTNELNKSLKQVDSKELKEQRINQLEQMVNSFKNDAKNDYKAQLVEMKKRAENLDNKGCLKLITEAIERLEADRYPDFEELERALKNAFDERLAAQLEELHQLEAEREQIIETKGKEVKELDKLLKKARKQLEAGKLAEGIENSWSLLESLRSKEERALTSFEPRLNEALKNFAPVSKLNSDESATVSRILRHLDGQRESFSKVSVEMRGKLEAALSEAESLLEVLKENLEATSAVAGKLVSGNILDNVFGGLGAPEDVFQSGQQEAPQLSEPQKDTSQLTQVRSDHEELNNWLDGCLQDEGVRDAVIFSPTGEVLSGCTLLEPHDLFNTLKKLGDNWRTLGQELTLGNDQLFTIETPRLALVASYPKDDYSTALILDDPSTLSNVLNKVRTDLPAINEILSGSDFS